MKKVVKICFILSSASFISTCYAGVFDNILDKVLGDNIYFQTILDNEKAQPADFQYSIPRATWSNDLKKTVVNYTMFVRPEDKGASKHPFLFYRFCSKPNEFLLHGVPQPMIEAREWKIYISGQPPLPYAAYIAKAGSDFSLKPGVNISSYQMTTGEPIDVSQLAGENSTDCGELFAGYGLGEKPEDAFNDMFTKNRFEMVFSTVKGIQAQGGYKLEVRSIGYTDFKRRLIPDLCSPILQVDIGCPK